MSGDVGAEVAAVLAAHLYNGCTEPACDPGSDPEVCVRRPFLNHLAAQIAPLIAKRVEAAKAEAWDEGWRAAQEVVELEGVKCWAHTVFPEGYEGNPYRAALDPEATP